MSDIIAVEVTPDLLDNSDSDGAPPNAICLPRWWPIPEPEMGAWLRERPDVRKLPCWAIYRKDGFALLDTIPLHLATSGANACRMYKLARLSE